MLFLGITWNPSDTIFSIGPLQIKYYNLLWITAFALGWALMKKIFQSENKSMEKLDSLFIHTVIATMLGARLGHVFFYDWTYYKNHLLEILLPIREGSDGFEFTGFTGLASHGAAIGIIIGMMLFIRKWPEFTLLGILDRVVIPVSIGAVCIRVGNFFNSEINGKPVDESFAFATKFIRDTDDMHPSKVLSVTKQDNLNAAYKALETDPQYSEYIAAMPFRHPAQLYEAFCYVFVFLILWYLFWKTDKKEKAGFLFGTFLVLLWTIRFFVEYVKKSQGGFEESLGILSTGQWLSVPFIIIGLYFMLRPKKTA